MKKVILIAFVFSLFVAGSCEKEDEKKQLPPITQNGAGTFGCLINGEVWLPSTNFYYPKWHVVIGENDITHEKYLSIIVYQGGAGHIGLFICEKEIDVGHKIILNRIGGEECIDAVFMSEDNLTFQIDAVHTGELIITQLDLNKKIVSGTFFFDAVNASGEKIEIRDGRFDLIINQIEPYF